MKRSDRLTQVYNAWRKGARTADQVILLEPMPYSVAANYLTWIRKGGGCVERARRLRNNYSSEYHRERRG